MGGMGGGRGSKMGKEGGREEERKVRRIEVEDGEGLVVLSDSHYHDTYIPTN